ncbi:MAG TPA: cupin domain-containing protein [Nocardioides sp.]|uniref:cupin domain-containing protein n=1 Tax=Nocardioides sp. TaxID=35761 RepID=UPI002B6FD52C|nr:cupin domain-containing protein [Nocardioides sp.]HQR25487.1 cupin domain-containing protein [Nocardioides sp.]
MTLHVHLQTARTVGTAAATMRTLASPSSEPTMPFAVWRTELPAGSRGPEHTIDVDQFVVVVEGVIDVTVERSTYVVRSGDGLKLPAGASRTVSASGPAAAATLTVGQPGARASVGDADPVLVPWTA